MYSQEHQQFLDLMRNLLPLLPFLIENTDDQKHMARSMRKPTLR